ncbi:cyclic nucleotide-binding domain-containing protein [Mucilaginibacter sp. HMF7410]|uniref:Cyclic nucleotide-binding domain-containing protein n=1 Tax=Mucilaginibacter arboris TaxID=2682090 RepID=A0A7K1SVR0_9SPHI|nr:cyclic nucleotide-binding domain-containing protein [Mucilaginibacter arboris]
MKTISKACDLKSCFLCKLCLKDWLPAIEVHKKNFFVKKGQPVFKEGDPVKGIYFVYEGSAKVYKKWGAEKDLIIRFAKKGDILGHLGLGEQSFYPVSTTALEPSIVCYIDMGFFESTLMINTQLTYKLMRFFANELQQSEKRMRDLVHMSVKGRIAQALLALKNQFGVNENGCINIELSRQDLASYAGVVYETLFRIINEFISNGFIALKGKSIVITNEEMLLKLTSENDL